MTDSYGSETQVAASLRGAPMSVLVAGCREGTEGEVSDILTRAAIDRGWVVDWRGGGPRNQTLSSCFVYADVEGGPVVGMTAVCSADRARAVAEALASIARDNGWTGVAHAPEPIHRIPRLSDV